MDPKNKNKKANLQQSKFATTYNAYLDEYADNEDLIEQNMEENEAGTQYKNVYWDEYADEDN